MEHRPPNHAGAQRGTFRRLSLTPLPVRPLQYAGVGQYSVVDPSQQFPFRPLNNPHNQNNRWRPSYSQAEPGSSTIQRSPSSQPPVSYHFNNRPGYHQARPFQHPPQHIQAHSSSRSSYPDPYLLFNSSTPSTDDSYLAGLRPGQFVPRRVSADSPPVFAGAMLATMGADVGTSYQRQSMSQYQSSAGLVGPGPSTRHENRPPIRDLAAVMSTGRNLNSSRASLTTRSEGEYAFPTTEHVQTSVPFFPAQSGSSKLPRSSDASTRSSSSKETVQIKGDLDRSPEESDRSFTFSNRANYTIPEITMTSAEGDSNPLSLGGFRSSGDGSNGLGSGGINGSAGGGPFDFDGSGDQGSAGGDGGEGPSGSSEKGKDKAKKANPLVDLIETETAYVSELGKIIKKVAGAWSRSNFPPAELDTMFRNVESIYRINRSFLKSLKEIGPNPSSPRALGDLLMRWIDDLEAPYLRYCDNYFTDFDSWPLIQNNKKLPPLLESISEVAQPDGSPVVYSDKKRAPGQIWTLDQLFALPQTRLKYYKKLYARLLKSTQEGRSDHRLLVGANEKLDELLLHAKNRICMSVLDEGPLSHDKHLSVESSGADTTGNTAETTKQERASSSTSMSAGDQGRIPNSSTDDQTSSSTTFMSPQKKTQQERLPSNEDRLLNTGLPVQDDTKASSSVNDLELRLDTSRVLDIFTMKPKKCQLRMNPPGIPFTRNLRMAADVVIHFTPTSTNEDIVVRRAHLFLLTDLFLVCERMTPSERAQQSNDGSGPDMWLLYPPLAGKHLRVIDEYRQDNAFSIMILKKEKLVVHAQSNDAKMQWLAQLEACQQFGSQMGLKVKTDTAAPQLSTASLPTPAPSPAIAVTPSVSDEGSGPQEGDTVRDLAKMLDGNFPFSPPNASPAPSRSPSLGREGSFRSFVGDALHEPLQSPPPTERPRGAGASSPAFAAQFGQAAPQRHGSLPPGPTQPGRATPSQMPRSHAMSPPPGSVLSQSPGQYPFMSPSRNGPNGPGQLFHMNDNGRPPFSQDHFGTPLSRQESPPTLPPTRPPLHLLNAVGRPERPSFGANGMGRPPPGPMWNPGQGPPPRPGMIGRPPPPRPSMTLDPPPADRFNREPIRRPSEPNLRNGFNGRDVPNRRSEGQGEQQRARSASSSGPPKLPSDFLRDPKMRPQEEDYSPPASPTLRSKGPKSSSVSAQMRCRLYLKQGHQQWKALGNARLKLYHIMPDNVKQLVVENDKKQTPLISSIIFPDSVERVGKVGVAIELSDNGARTGIVYMLHLRSEESAVALFGSFLEGSDRATVAS